MRDRDKNAYKEEELPALKHRGVDSEDAKGDETLENGLSDGPRRPVRQLTYTNGSRVRPRHADTRKVR